MRVWRRVTYPISTYFGEIRGRIKISPWRLLSRSNAETKYSYWRDTRLLNRQEVEALIPSEDIVDERLLGLTKSYCIIEPARP